MTEPTAGTSALSHYLRVVRRGAWIVVITAAVVTGLAIASSRAQEKVYEASAEVFLSGARNLPSNISDLQQFYVDPVRAAETQARLARVPEVARKALDEAGVEGRGSDDLLGSSTVTPNADADILTFTVSDGDPAVASKLASAYARAFTDYRRRLDTESIVKARRQLEARLASLRASGESGSGLYRELARNDQELRTFEALQGSNTAVIRAGGDPVQTQPKTYRNATLGLVLGLVLGRRARLRARRSEHAREIAGGGAGAARAATAGPHTAAAEAAHPRGRARDARSPRRAGDRGLPDTGHQPRLREPRPRREDDPGHERKPRRGQVHHGREHRRRARPGRQQGGPRRPRPEEAVARPLPGSARARAARDHAGGARVRAAERRSGPDPDLQEWRAHRGGPARCRGGGARGDPDRSRAAQHG